MAETTKTRMASEERPVTHTTCCIVGGGPAGTILALLLARKGIDVTLLESHHDFDREFRGDTLHPSVMEIMADLGLAERLLALRHNSASRSCETFRPASWLTGYGRYTLKTKAPPIPWKERDRSPGVRPSTSSRSGCSRPFSL